MPRKNYLVKLEVQIAGLDRVEVLADDPADALVQLRGLFGEEVVVASIHKAWEPEVCVWRRSRSKPKTEPNDGRLVKIWRRMIDG